VSINWEERDTFIRLLEDEAHAWSEAADKLSHFRPYLTALIGDELDREIERHRARAEALRKTVKRITENQA
jgi:hypothetical protein